MIDIQIWSKYTGKYHKIMMIPMRKSLILTSSSEKFSPRGGPPSGRLLKRRAVSDGPLRGGLTAPKKHEILTKQYVVSGHFSPGLS